MKSVFTYLSLALVSITFASMCQPSQTLNEQQHIEPERPIEAEQPTLSIASVEADVARNYAQHYGRWPSPDELGYWSAEISSGDATLGDLRYQLISSNDNNAEGFDPSHDELMNYLEWTLCYSHGC